MTISENGTMTTLRYEYKKLFRNRAFLLLFALLFIANTALAYIAAPNTRGQNDALAVCFADYKNDPQRFDDAYQTYSIAKEHAEAMQLQAAMNGEDPMLYMFSEPATLYPESGYSDSVFYRELYADRETEHRQKIQELLQRTETNLKVVSDPYMRSYLLQVQSVYFDQSRLPIQNKLTVGWNDFFGYRGTAVWLLFLTFAVSVLLATNDRVCDSETILFATKYGAKRILLCKLTVLVSVCALSTVLYDLSVFAVYAVKSGMYGADAFLAVLDSFSLCPYPIYIYEFVLFRLGFCIITLFMAGLVCLLIVRLCRHLFVSFTCCAGLVGLQMLFATIRSVENGSLWKAVHLFGMLDASSVCRKYASVNIAGKSIPLLSVYIIAWLGGCALLVFLLLALWDRKSTPYKRKKTVRLHLPVWYSLTAFEFKKQICRPLIVLTVALVVLIKGLQAFPQDGIPYREKLYQNYMQTVQNMTFDEAKQYLTDENLRFDKLFAREERALEAYQRGEITYAAYSAVSMESRSEQTKYEVFLQVKGETERILALRQNGVNAHVVYPTGWNKLLCDGADILPMLLLLIPSFAYISEEKSGFRRLLNACPNGRRVVFLRKVAINLAVSVCLSLLMTGLDIASASVRYGLPCADAMLSSLAAFEHFGNSLSLGTVLILTVVVRMLLFALLSVLATSLCALFERAILPIFLYGGMLFLPFALSVWQKDLMRYFSVAELYCFDTFAKPHMIPLVLVLATATLVLFVRVCKTE